MAYSSRNQLAKLHIQIPFSKSYRRRLASGGPLKYFGRIKLSLLIELTWRIEK
jgi:hypothetical protein